MFRVTELHVWLIGDVVSSIRTGSSVILQGCQVDYHYTESASEKISMSRIKNLLSKLRNNWKKTVFGSAAFAYGVSFGNDKYKYVPFCCNQLFVLESRGHFRSVCRWLLFVYIGRFSAYCASRMLAWGSAGNAFLNFSRRSARIDVCLYM